MKIFLVAGARPNFVKIAALCRAFKIFKKKHLRSKAKVFVINTGQHYDYLMSKKMFRDLNIPAPYVDLEVGSSSHGDQTAKIMSRFEKLLFRNRPDLVMVVGDVNSTMACSLVAAKMQIPIAHVESGLRSFDRTMPEEINRLVTDSVADFLFTSCRDADRNLQREGIAKGKIFFVGNVMVDTLLAHLSQARKSKIKEKLKLRGPYAVLTLHRPSNVDCDRDFHRVLAALEIIQKQIPVIFPVHPRTAERLRRGVLSKKITALKNLRLMPPAGYLDFICLLDGARLVLTDSGGIQEETTVLGVPCLTLRPNTERPVTIGQGTNILIGKKKNIAGMALQILNGYSRRKPKRPPLWDGRASERIFNILAKKFGF